MTKHRHLMTLTLTKANGEVLGTWTIGEEPEFDMEDPNASQEHDFYVKGYMDSSDFGNEIWKTEILRLYEIGYFNPKPRSNHAN